MRGQRPLSWAELAGAMLCGALALLTLAWKDWIEFFFRVDPDSHNGLSSGSPWESPQRSPWRCRLRRGMSGAVLPRQPRRLARFQFAGGGAMPVTKVGQLLEGSQWVIRDRVGKIGAAATPDVRAWTVSDVSSVTFVA